MRNYDPINDFEKQWLVTEGIFDSLNNKFQSLFSRTKPTSLQTQLNNPAFQQYKEKYNTYYNIRGDKNKYNLSDILDMFKQNKVDGRTLIRPEGKRTFQKMQDLEPFRSQISKIQGYSYKPYHSPVYHVHFSDNHSLKVTDEQLAKLLTTKPDDEIQIAKILTDKGWIPLEQHKDFKNIMALYKRKKSAMTPTAPPVVPGTPAAPIPPLPAAGAAAPPKAAKAPKTKHVRPPVK